MSKVYGYGRLALANDEEMAQQIKVIDTYCKANGLQVDEYFFDNGVSGLELNRVALNKMIDVLRGGDIVIVKDMARLSRNIFECVTVVELISNIGAILKVIY